MRISYKIKFADSFRFMSTSLSSLVYHLSDGCHSEKCTDCKSCLNYMTIKDDQFIFWCFECKKNYKKDFNNELIKRFANTYELCNGDIKKFILLLRKGIYPYEYMDSWERSAETLPDKEAFYSSLNMEDITDVDYRHAKRVFQNFNNRHLGDHHDLYVQSDTLLLADVFENFRNKCIEIYELDPAHFYLHRDSMASLFKDIGVELELLTDVDMLLMIEKGIRGGICHAVHRYAKANNKYIIYHNKNKESSYIMYLDTNNLYGWAVSQKLPVNSFKWVKNVSKIDEDFTKNYDEDSDEGYILEVDIKYPSELHDLHSDLSFLPERSATSFYAISKTKKMSI